MAASKRMEQLASEKEQELVSLRQQHAQLVQETLKSVENELVCEQQRLQQLQADFEYNLSLLEQRDSELARYDSAFVEVRKVVNSLTADNSELKVCVDSLRGEIARHKEDYEQLKLHYVRRIEELQTQMDAYRRLKDVEVDKEREKLEQSQRELQQRLLEIDLQTQQHKEQMGVDFEQILRQKDHEHQLKVDELNATALRHEAHARQLQREVRVHQSAQETVQEERRGKEEDVGRLEKQLKLKEWEREDTERMAEARIKELESKLTQSQAANESLQKDFMKRHAEMDRLIREKDASLQAAKEAHGEREGQLERGLRALEARLEAGSEDVQRLQWAHRDALAERDGKLERLECQAASERGQARERGEQLNREAVAKDLRIQALQDSCDKLRLDAASATEDLKRCQQELTRCEERGRGAQQARAQLEKEWQLRTQQVEKQALAKHQDAIKRLTTAQRQALAEVKELREALSRQASVVREVQRERDDAIAALSKHGDRSEEYDLSDGAVQRLKEQNSELHAVIKQMRVEMEQLTEATHTPGTPDGRNPVLTPGYVQYMEREVTQLKSEKNQLQDQIRELLAAKKPPTPRSKQSPPPPPPTQSGKSVEQQHRSHLVALSDTIAGLQGEKAQRELECMQLRSAVEGLEERLRLTQEKVYVLKVCQVPQSKLHQKLLCATQVIISLVKEKELLYQQLKRLSQRDTTTSDGSHRKNSDQPANDKDALSLKPVKLKTGANPPTLPPPPVMTKKPLTLASETPSSSSQATSIAPQSHSTEQVKTTGSLEQMSLHSLKFSESSDEQLSVERLFEMVEQGGQATSSAVDAATRHHPVHGSPPRSSSTPRGNPSQIHSREVNPSQIHSREVKQSQIHSRALNPSQIHSMQLRGKPMQTHSRANRQSTQSNAETTAAKRRKQLRPKTIARNYNVKDNQ